MKKNINLISLIMLFFINTFLYSKNINDYVDKVDVKESKRIFMTKNEIYEDTINRNNAKVINSTINNDTNKNIKINPDEITIKMDLNYIESNKIAEKLSGFNGVKISAFENSIVMLGTKERLLEIGKVIQKLDIPKRQIIIKANIIDTSNNLFDRLGIDWSLGIDTDQKSSTKGVLGKIIAGEMSLSSMLRSGRNFLGINIGLLKENGDIKIEAMPTLVALENETGEMKITEEVKTGEKIITKGENEYTESIFSEAGIVFKVVPEIKIVEDKEKILLDLDMEISNFKLMSSYSEKEGSKQKNQTKTKVLIKNGGSTFIGGLKQNVGKESMRKVPILGDVPIIGPVFRYTKSDKEIRDIYIEIEAEILPL